MFYIEPRLKLPFAENWNLSIQHQLTPTLAADIAYVGNQGVHRVAYLNFNLPRVGPGPVNPRRPFFNKFGWTQGIESRQCNCASSNYHSLQTKLEKRFANDFWFLGHYTWAKGLDTGLNGTGNIYNRRLEYAATDFDRTHVFVLNGIWELPLGRGKKMLTEGVASQLLGGWSINNVLTLESGLPFSPGLSSRAPLNTPDLAYRPDILGDPELEDPTRDKWFNAGPSTIGTVWGIPAPLLFGNAARNSLRGPGVATLDLSFFKNFDMSESARLQIPGRVLQPLQQRQPLQSQRDRGQPDGRTDHGNFPADAAHPVGSTVCVLEPDERGGEPKPPPLGYRWARPRFYHQDPKTPSSANRDNRNVSRMLSDADNAAK